MNNFSSTILSDADLQHTDEWTEADVRAKVVDPLVVALGYTADNIVREYPIIDQKTGNVLRPDYLLRAPDGRFGCVIEAKSPKHSVLDIANVMQAYNYAVQYKVRTRYFAVCNGTDFALWKTINGDDPIIHFAISDIQKNWNALLRTIGYRNVRKNMVNKAIPLPPIPKLDFNYSRIELLEELPVRKRAAKRHFGVHGYFTRQAWNVVAEYINHFSQEADVVLDPYGGSGVTAVEALVNDRQAIHVDINPMANFMVEALLAPVNEDELRAAYTAIKQEYIKNQPKTDDDINKILSNNKKYPLPKDLPLPKGSDVPSVHGLFTPQQMAELALLKSLIMKYKGNIRGSLMLMFSGVITRYNKTAHNRDKEQNDGVGGINAGAFMYYRYRIAPKTTVFDVMECFDARYKRIVAAKKEIAQELSKHQITTDEIVDLVQIRKGSASDLSFIKNESVDYIYTDPPYGEKIQYLDLSTMWNAWLDLEVTEDDYKMEAIEDGSHEHTFDDYTNLISKSLQEMFRVLKYDRWMSFVFAHKDPKYWHMIVEAAKAAGFEYRGTVSQNNGPRSFKMIQNPFTTLSGQLIINFFKSRNPKNVLHTQVGIDTTVMVIQTIESIIVRENGATLEQINNELVMKAVEMGFLHELKKEYNNISTFLRDRFDYDMVEKKYVLRPKTDALHIPMEEKIRYYLVSYLRQTARDNKYPTLKEIVYKVFPDLMNGEIPKEERILDVLEEIGERMGKDGWRLRSDEGGQGGLF